ncbi:MAG: dTDP-glucose 4,6-dehydratase [Acidiferrobacterales bacterium]
MQLPNWLVTGGAGFIGSNFVRSVRRAGCARIINLDKLTYAGHLENLADLADDRDHVFVRGDIGDATLIDSLLREHQPAAIVNFAAESHVDRSITGPQEFIQTNVVGTHTLLQCALSYWKSLGGGRAAGFRFLHVSTDEVYGSLGPHDPPFTEDSQYRPNSPYAASKAAADHLVRAYHQTFGLATLTTNCSNNYGPYQHPEKLIPLMIENGRSGRPLPVYGDGRQVRDWLYVQDHCDALRLVLERGRAGETYNIGGDCECANLDIVSSLCRLLDDMYPKDAPHAKLIAHVADRPGHDRRYAIDASKMRRELGWHPRTGFDDGLACTLRWYAEHADWVAAVSTGAHERWIEANYVRRGPAAVNGGIK